MPIGTSAKPGAAGRLLRRTAAALTAAVLTVGLAVGMANASTPNTTTAPHTATAKATANTATTATVSIPSTTNYPWNGLTSSSGGDQWGMAYGQCVSFAAWMIYQNFGGTQHPPTIPDADWFPSDGLSKGPVRASWGNAGDWNVSAANAGYQVDGTPHVGAIAQWVNGSDNGQFTVGHVAYVTAVNSDGSIDLAQFNLREDSRYSTLHMTRSGATDTSNGHGAFFVPWPDHFLHIGDSNLGSSSSLGGPHVIGSAAYSVTGTDSQGLAVETKTAANNLVGWLPNGSPLQVVCQINNGDQEDNKTTNGAAFTTWDKLSNGDYVYDWYTNTPTVGSDGYSAGIAHCANTYAVTGTDSQGLADESKPMSDNVVAWAANGTPLYVFCQTVHGQQEDGRTLNGAPYTTWDKLTDGTYVYDWYTNTPTVGSDGYSPGIAHCAGG